MFSKKPLRLLVSLLVIGLLMTINACQNTQPDPQADPGHASSRLSSDFVVYALTDNNQLLKLNTQNPGVILSTLTVTGIQNNERLIGIDFRPATGQLYAVSNDSRIYAINLANGMATVIGSAPFSPAINGDVVGFDFNPTVDRIRLVTNQGQNLRLHPETGATAAIDGAINGVPNVAISGVAYTNSRAGVTTTTLYDIDPITDKLYRQDPPNNGTLVEVGSLGIDIAGRGSFDISPDGNAVAMLINGITQGLYQINLTTGQAERLGDLPGFSIVGLAIPAEPVAYAIDRFNNLVIFNPFAPGTPITKALTGLPPNDMIYGIDFRPVNGQLYAISSSSRLYTINTSNGAATMVGNGPTSPAITSLDLGFDFNPTVDRIRVVTATGQNLRLHPETGAVVAIDGNLAYSDQSKGAITGAAYTNSFAGATTTVLYDLDAQLDRLVRQDPPNAGGLVTVGSLGVNIDGATGFDIGGTTNNAYALLRTANENGAPVTKVYQINLMTGQAIPLADFPMLVRAMTVGLGL
ncbi:DUF4394 domain-containing protein [Spirosoma sp. SC4-14]|uniref:DUF4394 domain-containing protein n=1 Tax=Spirosoma sp. SC4-14 TaxID=3128900 RepID=UPI0030D27A0A